MQYLALSYYKFVPIDEPAREVKRHKKFLEGRDATSRVYISSEGINGQLSASVEDAEAYMEWLRGDPRFSDLNFKPEPVPENIFPRLTIKVREKLVAIDQPIDLESRGNYLSPEQWRKTLEGDEDVLVLDGRNDYEWELGHFEGAERPPCRTFRDFPAYVEQLKERCPKEKKILMSCTGGIRCELLSSMMREEGFENVYQLEGGVIKYGQEQGGAHWRGKLFVFDDRLGAQVNPDAEVISRCHICDVPSDRYFNCANMDCNALFISCERCLDELKGCCQASCLEGERVRSYDHAGKPFRRQSCSCA
jgi:UPF0176 protein